MYPAGGLIAADLHTFGVFRVAGSELNILRDIHKHRSRFPAGSNIERHFDDASEILAVSDRHAVFRYAPGHPDDVHLLEGIVSDEF